MLFVSTMYNHQQIISYSLQTMQIVGEQIKLARLRRNLSVAQVAERATCSPLTVARIETGAPTSD